MYTLENTINEIMSSDVKEGVEMLLGTMMFSMESICPDKDTKDDYSPCKHVSSNLPKTYAWACKDDGLVPCENTIQWGEAMEAAGTDSCYRLFPTGGHGIAVLQNCRLYLFKEEK